MAMEVPRCPCRCMLRDAESIGRGMCIACHNLLEDELEPYTALADADDMIVSVHREAVSYEDLGFSFFDEVPRAVVDANIVPVPPQFCREPSTPAGPPIFVKVCDAASALKCTPTFAVVICSAGRPKQLQKTLRLVVNGLKDGGVSTSICVLVDPADTEIEAYKEWGGKPTGKQQLKMKISLTLLLPGHPLPPPIGLR
jgi:hypothetical protein